MESYFHKIYTYLVTCIFCVVLALCVPLWAEDNEGAQVYAQGDYKEAVKILKKKYAAGKAGIQERILLARAYIHLDSPNQAKDVLNSVLNSDSENPEANGLMGKLLFETKKYQEAIPYLKHALRLKETPTTLSLLGRCYYEINDYPEASIYLKKALKEDIRDPTNGFILGQIYLRRGYGMRAEESFLAALSAGMQGEEIETLLGKTYLLQRKFTGPITKRHIPDKVFSGDILVDEIVLGEVKGSKNIYHIASRYSAIYCGYTVLKLNPKSLEALYMICEGWLSFSDYARAKEYLFKIKKKEPLSRREAHLEARILLALDDYAGLDKHLTRAGKKKLVAEKEIVNFYYAAGIELRAHGMRKKAIPYLKNAESLKPSSEKIIRALAELSRSADNIEDAYKYYSRFVELFPDADDIEEMRNCLNIIAEQRDKNR